MKIAFRSGFALLLLAMAAWTSPEADGAGAASVKAFMKNKTLFNLARNGQGGLFPASSFQLRPGNEGVLLWFCYDSLYQRLFVALEQIRKYNPQSPPAYPVSDSLLLPDMFTYVQEDDPMADSTALRHFRAAVVPAQGAQPFVRISRETAEGFIRQFERQPGIRTYCELPFSCFGEGTWPNSSGVSQQYLTRFLSTLSVRNGVPHGYVRFYFTFKDMKTNRIRLTLLATNHDGYRQNVVKGVNNLEQSWPPPPPLGGN
ncbi:MAG: hypothetical protein K1X47_00175 [Cyclobacteriaceae bacterium]|nr:hypothetical protein [Cyclobacteriaceae bacterium]